MSELASRACVPCRGGTPPLPSERVDDLSREVPEWSVIDGHHLSREFGFDDFAGALAFVNQVGEVAEAEGHHPDIHLSWGRVVVEIWTHKIDGLTESDFILAAKIDRLR
ncbi:MAG: 4a-hydroxytetrahydrobiopterin dehydratase [Candidatus Krumholzibacteriia bacterium]